MYIGNIKYNRSSAKNCAKMQTKACNLYFVGLKKRGQTDNQSTSYLFFNFVNEMTYGMVNDTCLWRYKQQASNALNYHDQKGNMENEGHFEDCLCHETAMFRHHHSYCMH